MQVNEDILRRHGESFPVLSSGNLHYCLWHALREAKKSRTEFHRVWATHTLFQLARTHPFEEGNKRTSFIMAKLILRLGGFNLDVDYDYTTSYLRKIAAGGVPYEEVYDWILRHTPPTNEALPEETMQFIELLAKAV